MGVEIICPLYNAEQYILDLHHSILKQKNVTIDKITYIVTKSNDKTTEILDKLKCKYDIILPEEFSHSLTREKYAMKSTSDILVFITQDIVIKDEDWLYNLIKHLISGKCQATFSRQIAKESERGIEKYTREKNYPPFDRFVSKKDIEKLGLNAFFSSDASSATLVKIFKELNGFDQKKLAVSEDMYYARKIILNGYTMGYIADSIVYHSHDLDYKSQYNRYYEIGKFFGENPEFEEYDAVGSGFNLAIYVLKKSVFEMNFHAIVKFFPDMLARYLGMRKGKMSTKNEK